MNVLAGTANTTTSDLLERMSLLGETALHSQQSLEKINTDLGGVFRLVNGFGNFFALISYLCVSGVLFLAVSALAYPAFETYTGYRARWAAASALGLGSCKSSDTHIANLPN